MNRAKTPPRTIPTQDVLDYHSGGRPGKIEVVATKKV